MGTCGSQQIARTNALDDITTAFQCIQQSANDNQNNNNSCFYIISELEKQCQNISNCSNIHFSYSHCHEKQQQSPKLVSQLSQPQTSKINNNMEYIDIYIQGSILGSLSYSNHKLTAYERSQIQTLVSFATQIIERQHLQSQASSIISMVEIQREYRRHIPSLLSAICNVIQETLSCEYVSLCKVDTGSTTIKLLYPINIADGQSHSTNTINTFNAGILGYVVKSKGLVLYNNEEEKENYLKNISSDFNLELFSASNSLLKQSDIQSLLSIPVVNELFDITGIITVMHSHNESVVPFTNLDINMIQILSIEIGHILERSATKLLLDAAYTSSDDSTRSLVGYYRSNSDMRCGSINDNFRRYSSDQALEIKKLQNNMNKEDSCDSQPAMSLHSPKAKPRASILTAFQKYIHIQSFISNVRSEEKIAPSANEKIEDEEKINSYHHHNRRLSNTSFSETHTISEVIEDAYDADGNLLIVEENDTDLQAYDVFIDKRLSVSSIDENKSNNFQVCMSKINEDTSFEKKEQMFDILCKNNTTSTEKKKSNNNKSYSSNNAFTSILNKRNLSKSLHRKSLASGASINIGEIIRNSSNIVIHQHLSVSNKANLLKYMCDFTFDPFEYSIVQLKSFIIAIFEDLCLIGSNIGKYYNYRRTSKRNKTINNTLYIDNNKFNNFINAILEQYNDNPYHNVYHGISVLAFSYAYIKKIGLHMKFDKLDLFALLVSSLCHDVDHPGHSNSYEVDMKSDLSVLHNDMSVLENHHCCITFKTLYKSENNFLLSASDSLMSADNVFYIKQSRKLRKRIIQSILATDMSHHFTLCSICDELERNIFDDTSSYKDNEKLVQIICNVVVHTSDLTAPAQPITIALKWAEKVRVEFMAQVEKEKLNNLEITKMMDGLEDELVFLQSQKSFYAFVLVPFFKSVTRLWPMLMPVYLQILNNAKYYNAEWEACKLSTNMAERTRVRTSSVDI